MDKKITILGISGSLRKGSYNRALLQTAIEVAPPTCQIEIADIGQLPLFNQDIENPMPTPAADFKKKVLAADAILFATPEYNYSFPGVLKNAIDWASRPYGTSAWDSKPCALMGASPAMQGTSRSQYHLRQVFVYLNMFPLNGPELMIGTASDKFDKEGKLTDPKAKEKIKELLETLVAHTLHCKLKGK